MKESCPHCGETLPIIVDAFCPQCHEDLSDLPSPTKITPAKTQTPVGNEKPPLHKQPVVLFLVIAGITVFVIAFAIDIVWALF